MEHIIAKLLIQPLYVRHTSAMSPGKIGFWNLLRQRSIVNQLEQCMHPREFCMRVPNSLGYLESLQGIKHPILTSENGIPIQNSLVNMPSYSKFPSENCIPIPIFIAKATTLNWGGSRPPAPLHSNNYEKVQQKSFT